MPVQLFEFPVQIPCESVTLEGIMKITTEASGIVLFAHGSGSSRLSPRNTFVAKALEERGIATLLFDLLTEEEDQTYENRFNIDLLTERLATATEWVKTDKKTKQLNVGYFGASTGAAAALKAAARLGNKIFAVVSRGGRPDLVSKEELQKVISPTLLIVGGDDTEVIELNRSAYEYISAPKELAIVPDATHLFEEPGMLEEVARLAAEWFIKYL
ncbi:MAG: hydrolase [Candidatus Magasanikbacteria bacterium RIFCSPLOWO2_02_FULL_44_11]|uniref:Hydrolase n=2 Tax=Candidatus Magasanikiibacteriota TaxID=1752731 RepID=A0A1F6N9T1_9BACT|nr:MAG: hydrolase [Candidatus Magasanikbacteria bacterium RIFCSPHIGHO2_02_FULL_45_10]OGH80692.1 MAG: hydrolase [Candidatus Magasanikbacteria bacterium RIFCSPLOWO2_02_FULL_44_11]